MFRSLTALAGNTNPLRTSLYDLHVKYGGKLVDFAGYSLPVQYGKITPAESTLWTRSNSSIFDVSHMGQIRIYGDDRFDFFEKLVVGDIRNMSVNESKLSLLTNENGGIIDDCMITKKEDHLYVVLNAACYHKDIAHIRSHKSGDVQIDEINDTHGLIAVQGPQSVKVFETLLVNHNLSNLSFMNCVEIPDFLGMGITVNFARCGYTGEDGFELSIPHSHIEAVTEKLLSFNNQVKMAGLGARDILRIEAGLCLYGNDIDETTTPVEAGLLWTISKNRRIPGAFLGADKILAQINDKSTVLRKRIGFYAGGPPFARPGCEISNEENTVIGRVTSGTFSPTLNRAIGVAYVEDRSLFVYKAGVSDERKLTINVRNKNIPATPGKMPFTTPNYYKA